MDPRLARRYAEPDADENIDAATEGAFRADLERIRFSPYFSRLAAVTQVISQGAAGQVVHNRLTHTIKVTAVARAIATAVRSGPDAALADELGGCDPVVVQAAASAHDLGHPPFGHLGERILDRIARSRFGLADGFEGNAQTFRIMTELDVHGVHGEGLNLTAAVRAGGAEVPVGPAALPGAASQRPAAAAPWRRQSARRGRGRRSSRRTCWTSRRCGPCWPRTRRSSRCGRPSSVR